MIIMYQFVQINFIMCTRDRTTCIGVLDNNKSNFMVDMSVFVQTSKSYYRFGPLVASVVLLQFCLLYLLLNEREREGGRGLRERMEKPKADITTWSMMKNRSYDFFSELCLFKQERIMHSLQFMRRISMTREFPTYF